MPHSAPTDALDGMVERAVLATPAHDIHTHLFAPSFGRLLRWGIDDLLTHHSLVAEGFRHWELSYDEFWALDEVTQAELIWTTLFVQRAPISEACQEVVLALHALGVPPETRDLPEIRRWYAAHRLDGHLLRVMDLAGVSTICMTNSPFDERERPFWEQGHAHDVRFTSALRIDPLLRDWREAMRWLVSAGYGVEADITPTTLKELRRFLTDWRARSNPLYLLAALPPDFAYPADAFAARLLHELLLPYCAEHNLPLALIPGVRRAVNPALREAGDSIAFAEMANYERLIGAHPKNKFLLTAVARENQHELCVLARKFRNLHVFGCSWFAGMPSLMLEATQMRIELLGLSMTPHHSNARVLEQLVSRWIHARRTVATVLQGQYRALANAGWTATEAEIKRDVAALFGGAFAGFLARNL